MRISDDSQKRFFSSLVASLRSSGDIVTVETLKKATPELVGTGYDNWNHGTWYYTLFIYLKLSDFNRLTDEEKANHEGIIFDTYSKLFNDDADILEKVTIKPLIEQHLDWEALKGKETKKSVLDKLNMEKEHLINVGTGIKKIQDCDEEYKTLHQNIEVILSTLILEHPLKYNSLWDWYHFYSSNLDSYKARRTYINEKFKGVINIINDSEYDTENLIKYEPTGWEKIDNSVSQLTNELASASDRIDLNQIGLRCRETIILLAKEVYIEDFHHPSSYPGAISPTDSAKMLEGYIEYYFKGAANDEKRKYAKATNNLANNLTHKQTASKLDAKLCLSATISLINIVKIVNDECDI
jgi:hypothetical protein